MKYILTKNKLFDKETNEIIADKNKLLINNRGFSYNKIKKLFSFMIKTKSFTGFVQLDYFIRSIQRDEHSIELLMKLLINLIVKSFNTYFNRNPKNRKLITYRQFIDKKYEINFEKDKEINNIIKILEKIEIEYNGFHLNAFYFLK